MYASNTAHVIRVATGDDDVALRRLAELDSKAPLDGPVLVGEIAGVPVAALALTDDSTIADPFVPSAHLLTTMRMRANGMRAVERTPSLRERIRAAVPVIARTRAGGSSA
jgi:hypothetical protein